MTSVLTLEAPSLRRLASYAAALRGGWSPNTTRDVTREQLVRIELDPADFIAAVFRRGGRIELPGGLVVERLPDLVRWIVVDDAFVGSINLRWQEDAAGRPVTDLPEHVLGHIGYTVLPGCEGRGHATAALRLILVEAHDLGLPFVEMVCDEANSASRRIIEKNGGVFLERFFYERYGPQPRLRFRIGLPSA